MTRRLRQAFWVLLAVLATACGDETTVTTVPDPVTSPATFTMRSNLYAGGALSRTFSTTQGGTITMSVQASGTPIGLGLGVPIGNKCQAAVTMVAGVTEQLEAEAETGTYCALVYDPGQIATVVPFTVAVTYP